MFRSKRSSFVRKLWQNRCGVASATGSRSVDSGQNGEESHCALKPAAYSLFQKMKDEQLELLAKAVESKGAWESSCVCFPKADLRVGKHVLPPLVLICKLFRWPDLKQLHELKRLSWCETFWKTGNEGTVVCCNPFHLSRLLVPETPPPPYSKAVLFEKQKTDFIECFDGREQGSSDSCSFTHTDQHDTTLSRNTIKDGYWCKVAYWEHRTRVGRLYSAHELSVNIFSDLPQGNGFCLGQLNTEHRNEIVKRTRSKIGQGIILSQEEDGVWVYNRSDHPVFVNSPTLDIPYSRTFSVHKVMSGYSIKVFDFEKSVVLQHLTSQCGRNDGPYDPNSIRISFAKGWGPCYSRQFITSCPCWLEVLLNTSR
ncbi:mothers against decapentaplegic homolog 6-like [Protopterus annectens]|uniref:mothers against decapentaplegic homolog 6-like n=1 Tax=Protopterus annectens TaxID=7888 RepID=UPI001CF933F4|nr:mothers against decapentaplegic homolog 6-like [Protopterus annectens]